MIKRFVFRLLAPLVLWFGCGTVAPIPTPTPVPVDYAAVCQHLADLGCSEGAAPSCARVFERIEEARMSQLHPACLLDASSRAQARACGSVDCP